MRSKEIIGKTVDFTISYGIILLIAACAFSSKTRRKIKENANGACAGCEAKVGKDKLIASHIVHGRGEISNGRALCEYCEAEYHLEHAENPQTIGLTKHKNDPVVFGHVTHLDQTARNALIGKYADIWQRVLKRLKK